MINTLARTPSTKGLRQRVLAPQQQPQRGSRNHQQQRFTHHGHSASLASHSGCSNRPNIGDVTASIAVAIALRVKTRPFLVTSFTLATSPERNKRFWFLFKERTRRWYFCSYPSLVLPSLTGDDINDDGDDAIPFHTRRRSRATRRRAPHRDRPLLQPNTQYRAHWRSMYSTAPGPETLPHASPCRSPIWLPRTVTARLTASLKWPWTSSSLH